MEVFDFTPSFVWESARSYNVLISEFESGREQRRFKNRQPREWQLTFRNKPDVIRQIEWFFHKHKGPFKPFSWAPPGEDRHVKVRFKDETINITAQGQFVAETTVTLREVLG